MKIEKRDKTEKNPQAVKSQKVRILLKWLLEFRFSTFDVLSTVLESNKTNLNRFYNGLIENGFIQTSTNVHTGSKLKFVILAKAGVDYLANLGVDTSKAKIRISDFRRYSKIAHDISVQNYVVSQITKIDEVIWDRNISVSEGDERPDAMLHHENGNYWLAVQYERWPKEASRIYHLFLQHAKARNSGKYSVTVFVFDQQQDLNLYKRLFDKAEWPMFKRDYKKGHMLSLGTTFDPEEHFNLRKSFIFQLLHTNYL
jgi:hypothetical protein